MNFIKRHRYTIIIILIFILLFCLGMKAKDILIPDDEKAAYGNRLDEMGEHEIDKSIFTKIKSEMVKGKVEDITYRFQGKIVNFVITVSSDATINEAKDVGKNIMKYFEEKHLNYYTFQFYVKKTDPALNNFPIIGAKNPNKEEISWTQNREIVKEEDNNEE